MCNSDAYCTLGREGGGLPRQRILCLNFLVLPENTNFISSPENRTERQKSKRKLGNKNRPTSNPDIAVIRHGFFFNWEYERT